MHADALREVADSFNLELPTPITQVPTGCADNPSESNSVIDLMFLRANTEEIDTHAILLDLRSPSDHAPLTVNIIIREEFTQDKC